jgi:hypothetical protein
VSFGELGQRGTTHERNIWQATQPQLLLAARLSTKHVEPVNHVCATGSGSLHEWCVKRVIHGV